MRTANIGILTRFLGLEITMLQNTTTPSANSTLILPIQRLPLVLRIRRPSVQAALLAQPSGEDVGVAVGGDDLLGPGVGDGTIEALPVRMVREEEAPVGSAAAAGAPHGHPARSDADRAGLESLHPDRASRGRGREH